MQLRTLARETVIRFARSSAGQRVMANSHVAKLVAGWMAQKAQIIAEPTAAEFLTVLVFSAFRYRQDLKALSREGRFRFIEIPHEPFRIVNALFGVVDKSDAETYFLEKDPGRLALRARHEHFASLVIGHLRRELELDAIVTPAIHYRAEFEWCRGAILAGLPAVAIHKEFTLIGSEHLAARVRKYQERKTRFTGSHVLTTNRTGVDLFVGAGILSPDRIRMVGLPRSDRIMAADSPFRQPGDRRIVTLFSFGHLSGDLPDTPPRRRSHYFDEDNKVGFIDLVAKTHGAFARAALARPDTPFLIKPKHVTPEWAEIIDEYTRRATGLPLAQITNLRIVDEEAPALIRDSAAVIGFNSTVVIESRILDRPTIVPMFAEAAGKFKKHVFFHAHLPLFETPMSAHELEQRLCALVDGAPTVQGHDAVMLNSFVEKHLGYADGRTAQRVYAHLCEAIVSVREGNQQSHVPSKREGRLA